MRAILLLVSGSLLAQQEPVIRLDVQQVVVPVVVTDKKGRPVSGLHASDFQIYEDGVRQDIAAFSSDTAGSVDDIGALSKSAAAGPSGSRRTFVICIDTLHTAPASAARVRAALETLFEKEKPSDAQYVLIGIGRQMQVLQAATANPLAILLKIRGPGFQASMGGLDASALAAELSNLRTRMDDFCKRCACGTKPNQRACDSEVDALKQNVDGEAARWNAPADAMLEQFRSVVEELGKIPTGRTLILVSDGFSLNPAHEFYAEVAAYLPQSARFKVDDAKDEKPGLREALKIAADRNIAIYAIDSRGGAAPSLASTGALDAGASTPSGGLDGISSRLSGIRAVRTTTLQNSAGSQSLATLADSATMEQMARESGGVYFHDANDILKGFRGALAEGREYYVLAYVPKNGAQDGKFRRITVETSDRRLSLRAKSGYWAAGPAQ